MNPKRKRRNSSGSAKKTKRISGASSTVSEKRKFKNKEYEDSNSDSDDGDSDVLSAEENNDQESGSDKEYVVEKIVTKRRLQGVEFYYIKWKGWAETSNTWEPVENLRGCPKLLEEFEKQWTARTVKRKPVMRRRPSSRSSKRAKYDLSDNEMDPQKVYEESSMRQSYGVLSTWPSEREPESVEGVISVDGILTYIVKKKTRLHSPRLDRSNVMLVHSTGFRHDYPYLVIRFYESRIIWGDNNRTDEEKAVLAAKMSLLLKSKSSKLGKEVTDDLDGESQQQFQNLVKSASEDEGGKAGTELPDNDLAKQLVDIDQRSG